MKTFLIWTIFACWYMFWSDLMLGVQYPGRYREWKARSSIRYTFWVVLCAGFYLCRPPRGMR